jgi:hypothetical protein
MHVPVCGRTQGTIYEQMFNMECKKVFLHPGMVAPLWREAAKLKQKREEAQFPVAGELSMQ